MESDRTKGTGFPERKELGMFEGTRTYNGFATDDIDKAREFYGGTLGSRSRTLTRAD
jgi:hypothetical protein